MVFPSIEDITYLNRLLVLRYGGNFTPPHNMTEDNYERLRSLLEHIEFPPIQHESFEGVENLAAMLGFDLATRHLFSMATSESRC